MDRKLQQFGNVEEGGVPRLSLWPHGKGFSDTTSELKEIDGSIDAAAIKACRDEFIADCGYDVARTSVRETPFICKPKFIIDRENQDISEKVLISLLADRGILFSSQYRVYSSNRKFYRAVRESSGLTKKAQREKCMQAARESCGDSWRIYGPLIKKVEQLAIKRKVAVCRVERELIEYAISDLISNAEEMKRLFQSVQSWAMNEAQWHIEIDKGPVLSNLESQKFKKDFFSMYNDGRVPMSEFFIGYFRYHSLDGSKVLNKLSEWFPNIILSKEAASRFVPDALCPYCRCEEEQKAVSKASGHYKTIVAHSEITAEECVSYKRYKLNREALKTWTGLNLSLPFKGESSFYTDSATLAPIKHPNLSEISNITKRYLRDSRSGISHERFCETHVEQLLSQIENECTDIKLLPFAYLVVTVVGKGNIFSGSYSLENKSILEFSEHVYRAKPAKSKQRIYRLSFLSKLCQLFGLSAENCLLNLKYFLYFHGSKIESANEADLWRDILAGLKKQVNDIEVALIPPIEIQLAIRNRIDGIIPFEPESQYCYQNASLLQSEGYAKFLKQYRPLLDQYVLQIKEDTISSWSDILSKYLSFWSSPKGDVKDIRGFCKEYMKETGWKSEFHHQRKVSKFCTELCDNAQNNLESSNDCQEELNLLLFEAVIRLLLIKRATDILLKKSQKLLLM